MARQLEEFRRRLDEITHRYVEWEAHLQVSAIEALRAEMPHSIALVQAAVLGEPRTFDFNCHAFSFGLDERDEFWRARKAKHEVLPTGEFVGDRLLPTMTPIDEREAAVGDIVLYSKAGRITHSGVVAVDVIESKWGTAHRWRHALFELPASYGSIVRYYRAPDVATVVAAYMEFWRAA